ncbi:MAG: hypothetical protein ACI9UQ_000913 [Candidatus Krumholzibacteriia bacterium]|jgi:hypothetical protein
MAIDSINGAPLQRSGILENAQDKARVNEDKKSADANGPTSSETNGQAPLLGDTAVISDKAHQLVALSQSLETGRSAIAALPDVRSDKIALARERLQSGFYQSAEVQNTMAQRLVPVLNDLID